MMDLSELENAGVTVKRFCGLDMDEDVGCTGEAVGEIIAQLENGVQVPIPVCEIHRDLIQSQFDVERLT
ncbi:MAG TPA: hypothetical protein VF433_11610 [Cellvibrio sp.]